MSEKDHLNHTPRTVDIEKIEQLRAAFINLEEFFDILVPGGRELALAKTKLEEARMWAIKGIAMQGTPQQISITN